MWGAVGRARRWWPSGALLGLRRLRRAGVFLCAGYAAAMADIGVRQVVPGANDNLSGVAVLLSLAASLRDEPIPGVRVILLSAGSEESFMEGMQAYARRHFADLPRETHHVRVPGHRGLAAPAGAGGRGHGVDERVPRGRAGAGARGRRAEQGVELRPGPAPAQRHRRPDPAARRATPRPCWAPVDQYKLPSNYHWPTDTADRLDYSTVEDCARLSRRLLTAIRTS